VREVPVGFPGHPVELGEAAAGSPRSPGCAAAARLGEGHIDDGIQIPAEVALLA